MCLLTRWELLLRNNYNLKWVLHYLDDYLLAGPPSSSSYYENDLHWFLQVCKNLGFAVAHEKVGPATVFTFLGLELDSTE